MQDLNYKIIGITKLKIDKLLDKVILGDCLAKLKKIKDDSFDCCITDPPYNISGYDHKKKIGYLKSNSLWTKEKKFIKIDESWDSYSDKDYFSFCYEFISEISRVVKVNGNIALFGSYHNIYKMGFILEMLGLRVINSIVWYGSFSLFGSFYCFSNSKLMQEVIVYIIVIAAVVFLTRKFFFKPKTNSGCGTNCDC